MVVDEGDGVDIGLAVVDEAGRATDIVVEVEPAHGRVIALSEAVVEGVVLRGEVESHALVARGLNPSVDHVVAAVPKLAYGEVWVGGVVVLADILARKALAEVVAPAVVSKFALQPAEVGYAVLLNVVGHVVEVSCAAPVLARIGIALSRAEPIGVAALRGVVHLVVGADVRSVELEGAVVAEVVRGEVAPSRIAGAVVDYDIGNDLYAAIVEG